MGVMLCSNESISVSGPTGSLVPFIPYSFPFTVNIPCPFDLVCYLLHISFSFRLIFSPDVASPHAIGNGWLCDLIKEDAEVARAIKDTRIFICFALWHFFLEGYKWSRNVASHFFRGTCIQENS